MARQAVQLTGAQKAAVFLLQFGSDRTADVLRSLRESELAQIMAEVARLDSVDAPTIDQVLVDFRDQISGREHTASGGVDRAREFLNASVGDDKSREILQSLGAAVARQPFDVIRRADPRQVLTYLSDEHPQTIALVLAYLAPETSAVILSALPEELQRDVARRLARMDRTSPEIVERIEAVLEPKIGTLTKSQDMTTVGGVQALVDVLSRSDRATERLILEGLEQTDSDLAEIVRSQMFVFEDVITLDDRSVQLVLRQVDSKELAVALKGVAGEVRDKIFRNMSERAAANLSEEIELLGPMRLATVEEAQNAVVRVIRALEESGQIMISRGDDEFVV